MKSKTVSVRLVSSAVFATAFLFFLGLNPLQAAAQTIPGSVQTGQLLPLGQNTCQVVAISNIQPHIYGGVLESFDITISDANNSYVGILAQVGNTPIPLTFITRWAGVPNGLMIHVDTPDIPVNGILPVNLTLLSSPHNAPTCITTVSFAVNGGGSSAAYQPSQQSSPNSSIPVSSGNTTSNSHGNGSSVKTGKGGSSSVTTSTGRTASSGTSAVAAMSISSPGFLSTICSGNNAFRLWFVLLVIYAIIVAIVVFAEPWFLEGSVIGSTAAILVPLIALLAFWYLSDSCRAASWIPVVACILAIIGLFLAFREYELPPLLPAPSEQ